jgi:hypothetical protein
VGAVGGEAIEGAVGASEATIVTPFRKVFFLKSGGVAVGWGRAKRA